MRLAELAGFFACACEFLDVDQPTYQPHRAYGPAASCVLGCRKHRRRAAERLGQRVLVDPVLLAQCLCRFDLLMLHTSSAVSARLEPGCRDRGWSRLPIRSPSLRCRVRFLEQGCWECYLPALYS